MVPAGSTVCWSYLFAGCDFAAKNDNILCLCSGIYADADRGNDADSPAYQAAVIGKQYKQHSLRHFLHINGHLNPGVSVLLPSINRTGFYLHALLEHVPNVKPYCVSVHPDVSGVLLRTGCAVHLAVHRLWYDSLAEIYKGRFVLSQ